MPFAVIILSDIQFLKSRILVQADSRQIFLPDFQKNRFTACRFHFFYDFYKKIPRNSLSAHFRRNGYAKYFAFVQHFLYAAIRYNFLAFGIAFGIAFSLNFFNHRIQFVCAAVAHIHESITLPRVRKNGFFQFCYLPYKIVSFFLKWNLYNFYNNSPSNSVHQILQVYLTLLLRNTFLQPHTKAPVDFRRKIP